MAALLALSACDKDERASALVELEVSDASLPSHCAAMAAGGDEHPGVRLRVYLGDRAHQRVAGEQLGVAKALWAEYLLDVDVPSSARLVSMPSAIVGNELNPRMRKILSDECDGQVCVFVLDQVLERGHPLSTDLAELSGLAVHGELAARLGVDRDRRAIVLSAREVEMLGTSGQASLAHELGHLFGLEHTADAHRLMSSSRRGDCTPVLSPEELAKLPRR